MINETNLDEMTLEQLRHTPYILLHFKGFSRNYGCILLFTFLISALEVFRKQRNDPEAFPSTTAERKELQAILMSFRRSSEESGTKDSENFDEAKAAVIRAFQRTTVSF